MPYIRETNDNQSKRIPCGSDYNRASNVLRDKLYIVSSIQEITKVINTGFRYNIGTSELEVYLNGNLLRSNEVIGEILYGDYEESSNFSVTFNSGIIGAGDRVRFRVTSNSYDYSSPNQNNITQLLSDDVFQDEQIERLETKTFINCWTITSSLNETKYQTGGCGTSSAALCFGGHANTEDLSSTEIWNGSSWTITSSLNETKSSIGSCGTISAALCFGGIIDSGVFSDLTEIWNGTIWATTSSLSEEKYGLAGCGTISAALCFGGNALGRVDTTEIWNGTIWTTTNSLNEEKDDLAGCGTSSNALCFGGSTNYSPINTTEIWNGSVWATTNSLNEAKFGLAGCGTISNALCFGGYALGRVDTTEIWNGFVWATTNSLNEVKYGLSGCGTISNALCFGGSTGSAPLVNTTEKWANTGINNVDLLIEENDTQDEQIERLETKTFINCWTITSSLNETKYRMGGCGTSSDALCFGGNNTISYIDTTEIWNGSSWAITSSLNETKGAVSGCGTSSDALCFGGMIETVIFSDLTEIWNGTIWTITSSLSEEKHGMGGCGTISAALSFGGYTNSSPINTTEIWDGDIWAIESPLNETKYYVAGCGTISNALCFGGYALGRVDTTEIWNGTIWTTTNSLNETKYGTGGCGTISDALCFGGHVLTRVDTTEIWNGTIWATTNSLNEVKYRVGGCGTSSNALCFGGSPLVNTTEKWLNIGINRDDAQDEQISEIESEISEIESQLFDIETKMYFYQDSAPVGWTIDSTSADSILAVKGGSQEYNVSGGEIAGTWEQPGHILVKAEIPPHVHTYTYVYNKNSEHTGGSTVYTSANNNYDTGDGSADGLDGESHNHGNTYRPLAAVGIICEKD